MLRGLVHDRIGGTGETQGLRDRGGANLAPPLGVESTQPERGSRTAVPASKNRGPEVRPSQSMHI
jgi:hypothetical protein